MNKKTKQRLVDSISWLLNKDKILIQLILESKKEDVGTLAVAVFDSELNNRDKNRVELNKSELLTFFSGMAVIYNNHKTNFIIESTFDKSNSLKVPTLNKYIRFIEHDEISIKDRFCFFIDTVSKSMKITK